MKKTIALCVLASFLTLSGVGQAAMAGTDQTAPAGGEMMTDQELAAVSGGEEDSWWGCAFTFLAASALVVGVGALTAGGGYLFVGAVLASGTFGMTAELTTCK